MILQVNTDRGLPGFTTIAYSGLKSRSRRRVSTILLLCSGSPLLYVPVLVFGSGLTIRSVAEFPSLAASASRRRLRHRFTQAFAATDQLLHREVESASIRGFCFAGFWARVAAHSAQAAAELPDSWKGYELARAQGLSAHLRRCGCRLSTDTSNGHALLFGVVCFLPRALFLQGKRTIPEVEDPVLTRTGLYLRPPLWCVCERPLVGGGTGVSALVLLVNVPTPSVFLFQDRDLLRKHAEFPP